MGWEPASELDLERLYSASFIWLRSYGEYGLDPSSHIDGVHEGLPIIDCPPYYRFPVSEDEVKTLAPNLGEALGLQGDLEMRYWEPHYTYDGEGELMYVEPNCSYTIPQSESSHLSIKYLTIQLSKTGKALGQRMDEPKQKIKRDPEATENDLLNDLITAWQLERDIGADKITSAECQALQEILTGLVPSLGK
ncbi:hypothetical protein BVY00_01215 [bacterium G20]|nr:hypothetical protein BVY00_01215 [bacterium G20]